MPMPPASPEQLEALYAEIRRLELEENIAELDAYGLTVVPPEKVAPRAFTERLRDTIVEISEKRSGIVPDLDTGRSHTGVEATHGQDAEVWMWRLLFDDPIFEQALMNRTSLALITYLLGESAKLSNCSAVVKGPIELDDEPGPLNLHSDNRGIPSPFPTYSQVANSTWPLTDYDLSNGAVGYVPGSHRYCRHPFPGEGLEDAVPVIAPAGSLIVWHGNTWHGPFPRTEPGLRVSMLLYFCREYLTTQERYGDEVPKELLERNPERFATLVGCSDPYGWGQDGPDMIRLRASKSGRSRYS